MKVLVFFLVLVGFATFYNAYAELDKAILEPFGNSDVVIVGTVVQATTIENQTQYDFKVEDYLKGEKPFDLITATLDSARPADFPKDPLDYFNKPYFEKNNQVFVYLKQDGSTFQVSPYSFTIKKPTTVGPPTIIHATGPQQHITPQGEEIVISGDIKKSYLYALEKSGFDSSFNLVVLDEGKELVHSKKLDINLDGSYSFTFQEKNELRIPGKYSWKITYHNGEMGGEFIVKADQKRWTPLKQWKHGIPPVEINCSEGMFLMINPDNQKPACLFVSPSMIRFAENGWVPVRNLVLDNPAEVTISGNGGEFAKRYFSYFEIKDDNSITAHDINDKSLVSTMYPGDKIISDCIDTSGSNEITVSTLVQVNAKDNSISMTHEKQTWPSGFCEDDESILDKYYSKFFTRDANASKPEPEPEPESIPEEERLHQQKQDQAKAQAQKEILTDYRGNQHQIDAINKYREEFESGYFLEQFVLPNKQNFEKNEVINFVVGQWGYQPKECISYVVRGYFKPYSNYEDPFYVEKISEWKNTKECSGVISSDSDGYLIVNLQAMPGIPEEHQICDIPGEYRILVRNLDNLPQVEGGYYTCQRDKLVGEPQPWMELPD